MDLQWTPSVGGTDVLPTYLKQKLTSEDGGVLRDWDGSTQRDGDAGLHRSVGALHVALRRGGPIRRSSSIVLSSCVKGTYPTDGRGE